MVFSNDGSHAYILGELSNTVSVYTTNPGAASDGGALLAPEPVQVISTRAGDSASGGQGVSHGGAIALHPSGKVGLGNEAAVGCSGG